MPLGFAFTLTIFPLWGVFALSILAIFYGVFLSGKISANTFRPEEKSRGYSTGKIMYGASVFILLVLFHRQMHVVAGAWAIMAVGDASATVFGKKLGGPKLPWNREKTVFGSLSFIIFGTVACFFLMWYTTRTGNDQEPAGLLAIGLISFIAGLFGSVVESLRIPLDDNFTVPMTAGIVIYLMTRFSFFI